MAQAAAPLLSCCSRPATSVLSHLASFLLSGKRNLPLPSSLLPTRRRAAFSSSALRPSGLPQGGPEEEDDGDDDRKSRNALKREARRAVRWGMDLATFSAPQIKRVLSIASLEREVFDAVMLVKRLGPDVREGKRRQFNYIGRLLRKAQPELMDALIQASKDGDNDRLNALSVQKTSSFEDDEEEEHETSSEEDEEGSDDYSEVAARWFDGLVYKDPSITNEVFSVYGVDFDRQELRKLVRRVQSIQERLVIEENGVKNDVVLTRVKKPLIHFLRSLAKKSLAESKESSDNDWAAVRNLY